MKIILKESRGVEIRTYRSWVDARRASTQLEGRGLDVVPYLDASGPALLIRPRFRSVPGSVGPRATLFELMEDRR